LFVSLTVDLELVALEFNRFDCCFIFTDLTILSFPVQIAQLRDAAAKKDAEIERLQSLKDLSLPVESSMGVEKYKFKPVTAFPRRISMDAGSLQKPRRALMDAATGAGDVCLCFISHYLCVC
jgi:hypothetical protein